MRARDALLTAPRRTFHARAHSDRRQAAYLGLTSYATPDFVECTCFAAPPTANISDALCSGTCADPSISGLACGAYACGGDSADASVHAVALFGRANVTAAVLCEEACR